MTPVLHEVLLVVLWGGNALQQYQNRGEFEHPTCWLLMAAHGTLNGLLGLTPGGTGKDERAIGITPLSKWA
jgi:hypothetical protein